MVVKDADAAWEQYKLQSSENSIMKTSLAGQIDTLAAAMNDVNTKLDRLMPVADKVMGDEAALNSPFAQTQPDMGMDMGMGGDDMYGLSEEEMGAMEGGNMPEEEEAGLEKSEEEPVPEEVDETEDAGSFEDPVGDEATDEELAAIAETEPAPDVDESMEGEDELTVGQGDISVPSVDSTGAPSEEIPMEMDMTSEASVPLDEVGDNPVMAAYNAFTDTLKEAAHNAIDAGEMDAVNELADAQALMDSVWGERMRPAMDTVYKSLRKSAGVDGADAPSMSKDKVTPATTKAKVDHTIETPSETGKFEDKGDIPRALDNVTKSANNGEGEHEEDITEYENNDQGAVPNTANPGDAGSNFVDRGEFENAMYKSSGPSISEALEIPSFRDFAKSGDTFMESINALRKSSAGLGTELSLKKGMGSFGGMAGLIAAQNAVKKAQTSMDDFAEEEEEEEEDNGTSQTSMDDFARSPKTKGYETASPEQIDADYDQALLERNSDYGTLEYDPDTSGVMLGARIGNYEDDPKYNQYKEMKESFDDNASSWKNAKNMSPEVRYEGLSMASDARDQYKDKMDARRNEYYDDYKSSPYYSYRNPYTNDIDEFGMEKSCDDSVEKSSEMPVEGLENIEASEDEPVDDVGAAFTKNGKKIATFEELMNSNVQKSGWAPRPSYASTFGGDLRRPALGENIQKSAAPKVKMGYGVDPRAVTAADWNEYKLYKSRRSS